MNLKPLSQAKVADAHQVQAALLRAAQRARQIAAQTHTDLVVVRDGKLVKEPVPAERPAKETE